MDHPIRKVDHKEIDQALSLIWKTFSEFVAPDYNGILYTPMELKI